jgi:hypothetical protein
MLQYRFTPVAAQLGGRWLKTHDQPMVNVNGGLWRENEALRSAWVDP